MVNTKYEKTVLIICFSLIIISLYICHQNMAVGYEYSIYIFTPSIVWYFLAISLTSACSIILYHVYKKDLSPNLSYKISVLLINMISITILALLIIRGYYMWCMNGDPATHISYVKQILSNGTISKELFYPLIHIYTAQFVQLTGLDIIIAHKYIPLLFGIFYLISMFIYLNQFSLTLSQFTLSYLAASTLIGGWFISFTPNSLLNNIFPLLLFVFIKSFTEKKIEWRILFIIFVFFYPPFHPIPSLALLVVITTFPLPLMYIKKTNNNPKISSELNELSPKIKATLILVFIVWAISWISSFYIWDSTIINLKTLYHEGGNTQLSTLLSNINYAEGYNFNIIDHILKVYSGTLIYYLLAICSLPILKGKLDSKSSKLLMLYGPIFSFTVLIGILYLLNFVFGPLRLVTYICIMSIPFFGVFISVIIERLSTVNLKFALKPLGILVLLVLLFFSGIINVYPSNFISSTSYQTTKTETYGMMWIFENRNPEVDLKGISISPSRFADLLSDPKVGKNRKYYSAFYHDNATVPFHFGYQEDMTLGNDYNDSVYIGIIEKDKTIYTNIFPELSSIRWTLWDFKMLNYDKTLEKIYSSNGYECYYIDKR